MKLPTLIIKLEEPVKNDMRLVTCNLKRIWKMEATESEGEKEQ